MLRSCLLMMCLGSVAQGMPGQAVVPAATASPMVDAQGKVTFRLSAPAAQTVVLKAGGVESTPGATLADMAKAGQGYAMTKGADGVWSYTLGPIQPGVYRYKFEVDGVATTDPHNTAVSETLTSVESLYEVPGAPFMEYRADVPHGAMATVYYRSKVTGELRRMHVYTPPGYEAGSKRYPVLYLLHGGGDSDDSWPTVGRAGAILDNLIAGKRALPMMVVMPAGHMTRDTNFFSAPDALLKMGHDSFNEDLVGSVLPYVDANYRTLPGRESRSLAGLSMGGVQTLNVSLQHSELFAYVGLFSTGWFPQGQAHEESTQLVPFEKTGTPFKLFWVGVGKLDIAHDNSVATVALLRKHGIKTETHDSEGFHAWNNWRDYLELFAPKLFR